jgi:hypothetical protein
MHNLTYANKFFESTTLFKRCKYFVVLNLQPGAKLKLFPTIKMRDFFLVNWHFCVPFHSLLTDIHRRKDNFKI